MIKKEDHLRMNREDYFLLPTRKNPIPSELDPFYQEIAKKILKQSEVPEDLLQTTFGDYSVITDGMCTLSRKTYPQNWSVYNATQTQEKLLFFKIINDVVESIREPEPSTVGRPPKDKYDLLKALCIMAYVNFSTRRTISELKIARSLGYLSTVPHYNTLSRYMRDQTVTFELQTLFRLLAEPLKSVEHYFSVDSTGFGTMNKKRWVEVRDKFQLHKQYRKLHAMIGTLTNVITDAIVTEGQKGDSPYYERLLKQTAQVFSLKEVSADSAYLARENVQLTANLGAKPFIMPKSNTVSLARGHYPAWNTMINLWKGNNGLFRKSYHRRSNVEATFSMLKRKFGGSLRSKDPVAQQNEILCKVICHNTVVLIEGILGLGIDAQFALPAPQINKSPSFSEN